MPVFTKENMRNRFWEAFTEKEALDERTAPLRAKRDELVEKYSPLEIEIKEIGREIRRMEQPDRARLDEELSMLARALGNVVGERS